MSNPDDAPFRVFTLTDENRPAFADLALGAYVGQQCVECGHSYESVADIRERDPKRGHGEGFVLVDAACWDSHAAKHAEAAR
jgi:hypothetical protein